MTRVAVKGKHVLDGRGSAGCVLGPGWGDMLQFEDNPSSGLSLVVRHFPEPLAVAAPPTDLQQDLGPRVHIENALAAVGLGKKGRVGVLSHQWCEAKDSGDVLRVSSLLERINILLLP